MWVAGNKADDGKRFCTLQIAARCANGDPSKPRRGQPKICIVFRGQGKRISPQEKAGWHPDVSVRFQPKAWFDDALCTAYAKKEMKEVCAEAKSAGRESVVITDNLSGQTTKEFELALKTHKCKRHLLPTGVTDELQLIDDGIGIAVKREMGDQFDRWAMEGDHLDRWVAEKRDEGGVEPLAAWEKRVLLTTLAARAWEKVCNTFDFERAATRLGMRMTVDGSGDDLIKIQGLPEYSFTDADGGEPGEESDDGADPQEDADLAADIDDDGEEPAEEGGEDAADPADAREGEGFEGGSDESDGEDSDGDDTSDPTVVTSVGNAVAPAGYTIEDVSSCPNVDTVAERQRLIGKLVYVGWDTDDVYGWYIGTIHSTTISVRDKQKTPHANFVVKYTNQRTNNNLQGNVACELSARNYGADKWWVLLKKA